MANKMYAAAKAAIMHEVINIPEFKKVSIPHMQGYTVGRWLLLYECRIPNHRDYRASYRCQTLWKARELILSIKEDRIRAHGITLNNTTLHLL